MTQGSLPSHGSNEQRLSAIMRMAWKTHRLDTIREVVEKTISDLRASDPREVMGRSLTWSEELTNGPIRAALDACCDELRDGCGLPIASGRSDRETRIGEPAGSWTDLYALALERYRETAGEALETALQRLAQQATERVAAQ